MDPLLHQDAADEKGHKTPLQLICQGAPLPGIPKFPTFEKHRQHIKEKMALGFRMFARKGFLDGMAGHISVRDPENPEMFWTVSYFLLGNIKIIR